MTNRQRMLRFNKLGRVLGHIHRIPALDMDARKAACDIIYGARTRVWCASVTESPERFVQVNGRGDAYAHEQNDCVVRALSTLCDLPYGAAHRHVQLAGRQIGQPLYGGLSKLWPNAGRVANYQVYKLAPAKTVGQVLKLKGRYLVRIVHNVGRGFSRHAVGHVFAVIDGKQFDINPNGLRCRVDELYKLEAL